MLCKIICPIFFNIIGRRTEIAAQKKIFVAHLDSGADNSALAVYRLICLLHDKNRFSDFFLTPL
jgi:hypothetical protein